MKESLTFDDVSIVPQLSNIVSRSDQDISTHAYLADNIEINIPIVTSPMNCVTGSNMFKSMTDIGGFGFLHRFFTDLQEFSNEILSLKDSWSNYIGLSIGINGESLKTLHLACDVLNKRKIVCKIDVANAYNTNYAKAVNIFKQEFPNIVFVLGNICDGKAAKYLYRETGIQNFCVGIGNGSACTTRLVTGHGIPQFSAIQSVRKALPKSRIIADGGIRYSGDIVKAIVAGADTVMLGKIVAGADESPASLDENNRKVYMGQASNMFLEKHKPFSTVAAEGIDFTVPYTGPVSYTINNLVMGLRSGMSYSGVKNLRDLYRKAKYVRVSHGGHIEGQPHGIFNR